MSTLAKRIVRRLFRRSGGSDHGRARPTAEVLAAMDPAYTQALISMYHGEPQLGSDGQRHEIDRNTAIAPEQGLWLYNHCLAAKPKATLEIGMAYGYSTLYFLAAMARNQMGRHTSIDPFQREAWHGIGLAHAHAHLPAGGADSSFRLIEERSDRAAVDLARSGDLFDLIFIDGNHRFDDVLVDFYLTAPLCAVGGCIVFDDMWMRSIRTVASFVRTNRKDFVELGGTHSNVCAFQKTGEDKREWNDFADFVVAPEQAG